MNKTLKFFLVVFVIVSLSAVLAPIFYYFLSSYFHFDNIFNRLIMVFTVASAVLFILIPNLKKGSTFKSETWRPYGFDFNFSWQRLFAYGFLAGAFFVVILAITEVAFGPRYLRSPLMLQDIIERFIKGMTSGLIVGIVEEFLFRGFIYGHLQKKMNVFAAVVVASAFYSLCHFFENGQISLPEHPTVWDSLRLLVGYLEPLVMRPQIIAGEFIGLFLFGVILNLAFARTQSIFMSIGIHAGAVFMIKWQNSFVRLGPDVENHFFGKSPYYDGPFEWVMLVVLGFFIWWLTSKRPLSAR